MAAVGRRRLLLGTAGAAATLGVFRRPDIASATTTGPAGHSTTTDYATRGAFDALDRGYRGGHGNKDDLNDEQGAVGWGESYVLQAYLLMYQTYRDRYYLDKAIDHIDHVLANRDSERGFTDWRGLSVPGWRTGDPYSAGEVHLTDAQGRPTLRLRTARAYSARTQVAVVAGSTPGTFQVRLHHPVYKVSETHDSLTMDPASPDFAVTRINAAFDANAVQTTAKDLRENPDAASDPAPVELAMTAPKFHSCVHTGQIAYPIAKFARLVRTRPELRKDRRLRTKADEYYEAAAAAAGVHEHEYVQEGRYGYYRSLKDTPVNLDGADWPHNYSTSMARVYLELYLAGRRRAHRDRAESLVRTFADDVQPKENGTATWTYYWTGGVAYTGWTPADGVSNNFPLRGAGTRLEDISHAHIEITMMVTAHEAGLAGRRDLELLARTFTRDILTTTEEGEPTVHSYLGPSGVTGNAAFELISAGWLGLAPFDRDRTMTRAIGRMYGNLAPDPDVVPIYGSAWLNWATRR
ncbi:MAG TPA: hypothetical protein VI076_03700 [Actinopolymorphaceae bacterium]